MKSMRVWLAVVATACGLAAAPAAAGIRGGETLLVVPPRPTVIQFAFDMVRLRGVELLSYDRGRGDESLLLYRWDGSRGAWEPVTREACASRTAFPRPLRAMVLVGLPEAVPAGLAADCAWAEDVQTVSSLQVLDLVNAMDARFGFSNREWRELAARHHLELKDANEEKRRGGRYSNPAAVPPPGARHMNPLKRWMIRHGYMQDPHAVPAEPAGDVEEAAPAEEPAEIVPAEEAEEAAPMDMEPAGPDMAPEPGDMPMEPASVEPGGEDVAPENK